MTTKKDKVLERMNNGKIVAIQKELDICKTRLAGSKEATQLMYKENENLNARIGSLSNKVLDLEARMDKTEKENAYLIAEIAQKNNEIDNLSALNELNEDDLDKNAITIELNRLYRIMVKFCDTIETLPTNSKVRSNVMMLIEDIQRQFDTLMKQGGFNSREVYHECTRTVWGAMW